MNETERHQIDEKMINIVHSNINKKTVFISLILISSFFSSAKIFFSKADSIIALTLTILLILALLGGYEIFLMLYRSSQGSRSFNATLPRQLILALLFSFGLILMFRLPFEFVKEIHRQGLKLYIILIPFLTLLRIPWSLLIMTSLALFTLTFAYYLNLYSKTAETFSVLVFLILITGVLQKLAYEIRNN